MDEFAWASAVGRVRVLEKGLLSKQELNRLAESRNLEAAIGSLRDSVYGPYFARLENVEDFDVALERFLADSYAYIGSMAPEPLVITAYRARYDFHNLKVFSKSRLLGIPREDKALSLLGNIRPEDFIAFLDTIDRDRDAGVARDTSLEDEKSERPDLVELKSVLARTYETLKSRVVNDANNTLGLSPLQLDSLVDRAFYGWAQRVFRRFGYDGVSDFLSSEIDILNLRMALRAKRLGLPCSLFSNVVLPGGKVPSEALVDAYGKDGEKIKLAYKGTPWERLAREGVALMERGERLTAWEKDCDDALFRLIKKARILPLGPEPVIGYIAAREAEVKNIRIILAGKQAELSAGEIAERLRESYV
ncbi:MAG TPA: hypothetical protein GXX30_07310 [Firmicutes bacterium]|nr:hypothetical protein [Candidatus Fermentithermobacillaceae bacterium]